jgi:ubiquinol-cytochrome c reductase cytochrome c1 subunit
MRVSMIKSLRRFGVAAGVAVAVVMAAAPAAFAADDASHGPQIERQKWSFSGPFGQFDQAQLQRGFQVYKEVCSSCHTLKRVAFRNLAQPGGPEFPVEGVKALAGKEYKVDDEPNDDGKIKPRAAVLSDYFPPLYKNEKEARSIHNGALPPDLSLMAKARNFEADHHWLPHIFAMIKDIAVGYQEGGADYIYALLNGYADAPAKIDGKDFKVAEGMHYNKYFPGYQIGMAPPPLPVKYGPNAGATGTVDQNARDLAAFLSWTADPSHDQRKRMGWQVLLYLLITSILLYIGKKRLWAKLH